MKKLLPIAREPAPRRREAPRPVPVSSCALNGPVLDFLGLDVLWLQVTGTVCNIACRHCFISCGPRNESHAVMTREDVLSRLEQARALGVKEYYFTGGEPFLHSDIFTFIEETLRQGPLTILTNGMLIDEPAATRLAELAACSPYSLDLRVSLDGASAQENDPIRGRGTFESTVRGAQHLERAGLTPVLSVTTVHAKYASDEGRERFFALLRERGFHKPRVKLIPPFKLGREAKRSGAYGPTDALAPGDLLDGEAYVLQCGSGRTVTSNGVFPCPILIEEPGARMSESLEDSLVSIRLNHPACVTCHVEGFSCRT